MNRTFFFVVLCLFLVAQAFGGPGHAAAQAGKPPGGAPVSAADSPAGTAAPVVKPGTVKSPAQAALPVQQKAAAKRPAVEKRSPTGGGKTASLRLKSVECGADRKGRERVSFTFDRLYRPVLKTLPGEKPRIYFDVPNASVDPGVQAQQDGKGPLVRQVRISHDSASGSLRAAIELVAEKDYVVRPILYRKENRFLLEIEPKKPRSRHRP